MSSRPRWRTSLTRSPRRPSAWRRCSCGRSERTCGRTPDRRPTREQQLRARSAGRDAELGIFVAPRPVHLVDRALHHPAGHGMDLGLVPQLHELEVDRTAAGTSPDGCRSVRREAPLRSRRRRRAAPSPTADGRTRPAGARGPSSRRIVASVIRARPVPTRSPPARRPRTRSSSSAEAGGRDPQVRNRQLRQSPFLSTPASDEQET